MRDQESARKGFVAKGFQKYNRIELRKVNPNSLTHDEFHTTIQPTVIGKHECTVFGN
jgi:hypothetical protein